MPVERQVGHGLPASIGFSSLPTDTLPLRVQCQALSMRDASVVYDISIKHDRLPVLPREMGTTTGYSTDMPRCARYNCRPAWLSLLPTTRSGEEEAD